ncbi:type II secretion system protein GspL [Endozoicomonas euniceicola]|uniref:Type II secretion system protein L n=1 Tax=Endozoicomonas euniceicola TaxID=1234143 RepID=A0ABY6GN53_9GAMM|nr:type II secretion system protein GspL [Endozoicomonas euniceicola]UYM14157.1 type II secretion system protein GspL [Endozoicomonas euniceicola]
MTSDPLNSNTIKQPSTGGTAKNLLVIRLPLSTDDAVYWSTDSDYGTTSVAELGELKQLTSTHRCKILVPGEAVGLHAVEHSGKLNRTMLQTLPWHLEDDLAAEVEDMHFALLSHSDGKAYMAVVAKSLMEQWQAWLIDADINSRQWLPDSLSLPFTGDECAVLELNDQYLVRTGEWQAAVCDPSWLPLYLESLHSESDDVKVRALSPMPDDTEIQADALHHENALQPLLEPAARSSLNLLQGDYQPESMIIRHLKPWRTAAALLLTTCTFMLGVNMVSTARLESQADALRAEAYAIYNDLFPGERLVRLEYSLQQKLSALKQPGDQKKTGLPALLNELAPTFKSEPALKPVQMDYDHSRQELRMSAESDSFNTFSRFREQAPASVSVTVQTVEQQEEVVIGALVIRSNDQ